MSDKGIELLAPAGDFEIFKKVIDAGADAVYFAGRSFGARAFADNFSDEEVLQAIKLAHLKERKTNLTVNTLLKNREIENDLYDYIRPFYEEGLDAVIVQDIGVFQFLKYHFPELSLHASTQMTICNSYGAEFLKELGAERVVTARELSIAEISNIYRKTGMEIESFVHGALCVCYSGQCLMSSMLGGRSGNRGRCAQPCRLPYKAHENGNKLNAEGDYLLSPKDLCGINDLKRLHEAGVFSFKIEGRMKSLDYASKVVYLYRKYFDMLLDGQDSTCGKEDYKKLLDLGNRSGFTNLYYDQQNGKSMMSFKEPAHKHADVDIEIPGSKIMISGKFTGRIGLQSELVLNLQDKCFHFFGPICQEALHQPMTSDDIYSKLTKTGQTDFVFSDLKVEIDDNIFIPVKFLNELRRNALEELSASLLSNEKKEAKPLNLNALARNHTLDTAKFGLLCTLQNTEYLSLLLDNNLVDTIALPFNALKLYDCKNLLKKIKNKNKKTAMELPAVLRVKGENYVNNYLTDEVDGLIDFYIAKSFDTLGFLMKKNISKEKVILDSRIYTFSNITEASFHHMGYLKTTMPFELNYKELRHMDMQESYLTLYGRTLLMTTANCTNKNLNQCDKKSHDILLEDRKGIAFPVRNECDICYNVIYNSLPYSILDEKKVLDLNPAGYRIDFTYETEGEMKEIMKAANSLLIEKKTESQLSFPTTRGHFNRGVD